MLGVTNIHCIVQRYINAENDIILETKNVLYIDNAGLDQTAQMHMVLHYPHMIKDTFTSLEKSTKYKYWELKKKKNAHYVDILC